MQLKNTKMLMVIIASLVVGASLAFASGVPEASDAVDHAAKQDIIWFLVMGNLVMGGVIWQLYVRQSKFIDQTFDRFERMTKITEDNQRKEK